MRTMFEPRRVATIGVYLTRAMLAARLRRSIAGRRNTIRKSPDSESAILTTDALRSVR